MRLWTLKSLKLPLSDKAWNSGLSFPPTPRVGTRSEQAKSCSRGLGSELFLFRCTLLSSVSLCCKYSQLHSEAATACSGLGLSPRFELMCNFPEPWSPWGLFVPLISSLRSPWVRGQTGRETTQSFQSGLSLTPDL